MNRVYVSGRISDELQYKQLRNYLWVATGAEEYYKKKEPHMTIVPGFSVEDRHIGDVKNEVNSAPFINKKVEVNSLSVYENIHKPYVVQLDVNHDFHSEIDSLMNRLQPYAKSEINKPVSAHITLFKTQGWWDTIPKPKRKKLQQEVMSTVGLRDTEISSLKVKVQG